tara:strand:- start:219 stop:374 length:156 start_codon:yes stop_codon:yes gene_type:complete
MIVKIQKIVGAIFVNPLVDFKKPLETIPRIIPKNKKIYPEKLPIVIIRTIQ